MTREERAFEASKRFEESLTWKDLATLSKDDMCFAFQLGVKWAESHPESPWISVKYDLPCNHSELITCESSIYSEITMPVIVVIHNFIIMSRMYKEDGKWYWENDEPTHWMPIPELPKE